YYWLAMLSYKMFGVSDWAARVPSAFCATSMVIGIYIFVRSKLPAAALDAALITASSAACLGFARAASTDMPLAAALTLAFLCWFAAVEGTRHRKDLLALAYFFLALATLAKGPVAPALAFAIVIIFALFRRDLRVVLATLWWPTLLLYI